MHMEHFYTVDEIAEKMLGRLPSGSGFDAKWEYKILKNWKIKFSSSYHQMDEHGYYDGWVDFSVTVDLKDDTYRLVFHGDWSQKQNAKYMHRQYFEDTIHYHLFDKEYK